MVGEEVVPPQPDLTAIRGGLVIDARWLDLILTGQKNWEMRGQRCLKREWIGLIQKGSKTVIGVCRVVGERGPLDLAEMTATYEMHRIPLEEIQEAYDRGWRRAWVLGDVHKLRKLIPYHHRGGAQKWVIFDDHVRVLLGKAEVKPVWGGRAIVQ